MKAKSLWQHKKNLEYKRMYNGGFQWLNPRWSPNPLRDRIWKHTGLENIRSYFNSRCRWMTPKEMAQEIGTPANEIRTLLSRLRLTHKNWYFR